jgi:hypothetical protein
MIAQRAFGRRTSPQRQPLRAGPKLDLSAPEANPGLADIPAQTAFLQKEIALPHPSDEAHDRDQSAKRSFKMPWRQLSLMASLCFGIASLVLPDSINDELDWPLYALMALSAYAGLSKRFLKS